MSEYQIARICRTPTKDTTQLTSNDTINPNSSKSYIFNDIFSRKVAITVRITYNSSATAGATLNIYSSPDNINYDTEPIYSETLPFTAGETIQKTITIDMLPPYISIELTNTDQSQDMTASIWVVK